MYKESKKKKKNLKISIHIVLKNYKYIKSLFLHTLRCNHLPTKAKAKTIFFLILSWLGFFILLLKLEHSQ